MPTRQVRIRRLNLFALVLWLAGLVLASQSPYFAQTVNAADSPGAEVTPSPYAPNLPTGANRHKIGIATHPWWLDMHLDTFIYNFKQLNVGIVRLPVEWKVIEPQPGVYDWTVDDRLLNRLNDEGFEVVAEFVTIPAWASNNPTECAKADIDCGFNLAQSARFEAAVTATARRYPFVRHWEFWNEPEQWPSAGREPGVYGEWLKFFYRAIKQADPTMLVAATTLAGANYMTILYNYIEATTGTKNYPWDAVGFHPYNIVKEEEPDGELAFISKKEVERLRNLMVERGDAVKPMWITEIGFSGDPVLQSTKLISSFDWFNSKDYISMVALHMLHDWSEEAFGLMATEPEVFQYQGEITSKTRFVPKQPYFDTFKNYPKRTLLAAPQPGPDTLVFVESGHTVRGIFKQIWQSKGGLALFGLPKTGQFYERNAATGRYYLVQYFERVRMEYHPELSGTPYVVQYGLLGTELMVEQGLLDKDGRPMAPVTRPQPALTGPDNQFFAQTGLNVSGTFLTAWKSQGGLSVIGLPRSRAYDETAPNGERLLIQYFERARMELHTGPDGRQYVLFGLLANQRLAGQGRLLATYQPDLTNPYNPANFEFLLN